MEDLVLSKDWKTVYTHISEESPSLKVHIMDTISFDRMEAHRPLLWVNTSPDGLVASHDVRSMNLSEIIQLVINFTSPDTKPSKYFPVFDAPVEPLAVLILREKRIVLNGRSLLNLASLYPMAIDGITVLKHYGQVFDSRVFIYEMFATQFSFDDSVRVRLKDLLEKDREGVQAI